MQRIMLIGLALATACACNGDDGSGGAAADTTGDTVMDTGSTDGGETTGGDMEPPVDPDELRTTTRLMNDWQFVKDDDLSDAEALASTGVGWDIVDLPHTWNAEDAATPDSPSYDRGLGWYRLEFPTPTTGVRHWLEFGAASLVADVWLNGEPLGHHAGGFTQFRFDITEHLAESGTNVLVVKVDNSVPNGEDAPTAIDPLGGDFNKSGGLYRHVALVSTAADVYFALDDLGGPGVYATTLSINEDEAFVDVRSKLTSTATQGDDYVVRVSLVGAGDEIAAESSEHVHLPAGASGEVQHDLRVANPRLWNGVEDPHLYRLVAELLDVEGTTLDRVVQRFGIRVMRFDVEEGFFLNGEHVRLRGAAMHQDFERRGWAVRAAEFDASLEHFTAMGANAIRLGHYPFRAYVLDRVSELGLVAWAEKPSGLRTRQDGCAQMQPTDEFMDNAEQQLRETIRQQYNHAAVALWSIGNETTASQSLCDDPYDNVTAYLHAMHDVAKDEDPSRPTVYAEFPHPVEREGLYATEGITDLFATNRYFLWYHEPIEAFSPLLDALHELAADQPLALSEYGAGSSIEHHTDNPLGGLPEVHTSDDDEPSSYQPEEYASYAHEQNYRVIADKPYLWGTFAWNMFDFGSTNRNEGGVLGINTKGLVTFDREIRKDPFYFYQANWSDRPVTYITSRRYTDRAYAVTDVKVYSNADSVELSIDGTSIGTMTSDDCELRTCVFEDVQLAVGENTITAVGDHGGGTFTDTVEWTLGTTDVNIAAGFLRTGYVSANGTRFGSDNFFEGGSGEQVDEGDAEGGIPEGIVGTSDPQLFKYSRRGDFSYDIPLPDGTYDVTLGFLEPDEDAEVGDRVFDVRANGSLVLESFDILEAAGQPLTAVTRTFTVEVVDGRMELEFDPEEGDALVNLITTTRT